MMGADFRQLPTFSLWAGVEVAHPVAVALGAHPAECYDTHTDDGSRCVDIWCRLKDRPSGGPPAPGEVVGIIMPPATGQPPAMLRAVVIWCGPDPAHVPTLGPAPHLLHVEVSRW